MPVEDVENVMKSAREALEDLPEIITERFEIAIDDVEQKLKTALKDVRRSAEDLRDNTRHTIKRYPFESVLVGLGVGLVLGALGGFFVSRKLD